MIIPFEEEYKESYYKLLDQVFASGFWSDGAMQRLFEEKFEEEAGMKSRAVSSGGAGLLAILEYIGVNGSEVIVPANTFWATPQAVRKAGGIPVYADCNKTDLCLSYEDTASRITEKTKAVIIVHIGGHIAFEIEKIQKLCREKGIFLIEDCAHAHGAQWNGKKAGSWGIGGSYSFYATKTLPLGEGGMVVSRDEGLIEFVEKFRNYGKEVIHGEVTYPLKSGFNYRINEFTAALGVVQMERLPLILNWKRKLAKKYDEIFENRVHFPEGMVSGYYKYIVFDYALKETTGKVFDSGDLGYRIEGRDETLPDSEWVTRHHRCAPIYYGWEKAELSPKQLKEYLLAN